MDGWAVEVVCLFGAVAVRARYGLFPTQLGVVTNLAVRTRFGLFPAQLGLAISLAVRAPFGLFPAQCGLAISSLCVRARFGLFPAQSGLVTNPTVRTSAVWCVSRTVRVSDKPNCACAVCFFPHVIGVCDSLAVRALRGLVFFAQS